jgi:hypothetical protein
MTIAIVCLPVLPTDTRDDRHERGERRPVANRVPELTDRPRGHASETVFDQLVGGWHQRHGARLGRQVASAANVRAHEGPDLCPLGALRVEVNQERTRERFQAPLLALVRSMPDITKRLFARADLLNDDTSSPLTW